MKSNNRARQDRSNDEGVSPVIAVILMVAITVVLAATVYVWVSGFASDDQGTENAQVRAAGLTDSTGEVDWIRLTLVKGENAPYGTAVVDLTMLSGSTTFDAGSQAILCEDPQHTSQLCDNDWKAGTDSWAVGQTLYVPCQADGAHQLTLTIRGSTILDERVNCDKAAA